MSSIHAVNVGGNSFDITDSSNVAPIELTNFATRTYAKDRCFIMADGLLYRAMVEIQSGDPIVINGNCKRTTLDEILSVIETDSDLIAPTEDGTTASTDYAIGEQIVRSGILYKVIDEITEGDTFVVGNNIEIAGTLTSQIQTLEDETSDIVNVLGAKNLCPINNVSQVMYGVTFTLNSDGSIHAVGTATQRFGYALIDSPHIVGDYLTPGTYVFSGCPDGGVVESSYWMRLYISDRGYDIIGGEQEFTISDSDLSGNLRLSIVLASGATIDETFYPMIRPASIVDDTYVPYAMTNRELTEIIEETGSVLSFTTGAVSDFSLKKCGRTVMLTGKFYNSNAVTSGGVIAQGTISSKYKPICFTTSMSKRGTDFGLFTVEAGGNFSLALLSSNSLAANRWLEVGITFLV